MCAASGQEHLPATHTATVCLALLLPCSIAPAPSVYRSDCACLSLLPPRGMPLVTSRAVPPFLSVVCVRTQLSAPQNNYSSPNLQLQRHCRYIHQSPKVHTSSLRSSRQRT